jgi:hypothetical protein
MIDQEPTMTNSPIWVIVANDNDATICASTDGSSRLLRVLARKNCAAASVGAARHDFARQIMSEMFDGAMRGSYAGVILIANQTLMGAIDRVTGPQIRKLLIAQIVEEPAGKSLSNTMSALSRAVS